MIEAKKTVKDARVGAEQARMYATEVYDTERHLLYVACTRARDHLVLGAVKRDTDQSVRLAFLYTIRTSATISQAQARPGDAWHCTVESPEAAALQAVGQCR